MSYLSLRPDFPAMRRLDRVSRQIAEKDAVIYFVDESGRGKEVTVPRARRLPARRGQPGTRTLASVLARAAIAAR